MVKLNCESGGERKVLRQQKWAQSNPEKVWAHAALRSAVRRGLVEKKSCEICGANDVDAHHDDYSRPMAVRWLCRKHHKDEHRKMEGGAE